MSAPRTWLPARLAALAAAGLFAACPGTVAGGGDDVPGDSGQGGGSVPTGGLTPTSGGSSGPVEDPDDLAQRLFVGLETFDVFSTYGQYSPTGVLHDGLDLIVDTPAADAEPVDHPKVPVRSLEAGVVWEFDDAISIPYYHSITIGPASEDPATAHGLRYLHVHEPLVAPGDPVAPGQVIGYVAPYTNGAPGYVVPTHLHLEWVRQTINTTVPTSLAEDLRACGDPLDRIGALPDSDEPAFVKFELLPAAEDGSPREGYVELWDAELNQPVLPEQAAGRTIELVVQVTDRAVADSAWPVCPRSLKAVVRKLPYGEPWTLAEIDLGLPIWGDFDASTVANSLYAIHSDRKSNGFYHADERAFFLIASREPQLTDEHMDKANGSWVVDVEGGRFEVELTVQDQSGKIGEHTAVLSLGPE